MKQELIENIISILGKMKDLKRSGWLKRDVSTPESDAEHSFSVSMLVLLLAPKHLNKERCLELALVHDLAEVYSGDYTPVDDISKEDKVTKELEGIKKIAIELSKPKLVDFFVEYEEQLTPESRFVYALDKLDNIVTASWYDDNNRSPQKLLPEFSNYANRCISAMPDDSLTEVKEILNYIRYERNNNE